MAQSRAHKNATRNYGLEYRNYQGKPKQIQNRSLRNQARRVYEAEHGNLGSKMDVDHVTPLSRGGRNVPSNLRSRNSGSNRSFPRTRTARMKAR